MWQEANRRATTWYDHVILSDVDVPIMVSVHASYLATQCTSITLSPHFLHYATIPATLHEPCASCCDPCHMCAGGEGLTLMVPFADLANHSIDYNSTFCVGKDRERCAAN